MVVRVCHVLRIAGKFSVKVPNPPCLGDHRLPLHDAPGQLGRCSVGGDIHGSMRGRGEGHVQRGDFPRMPTTFAPLVVQAPSHWPFLGQHLLQEPEPGHNPVGRPIVGSLWCHRRVHASYLLYDNFQINSLTDSDVAWMMYTTNVVEVLHLTVSRRCAIGTNNTGGRRHRWCLTSTSRSTTCAAS